MFKVNNKDTRRTSDVVLVVLLGQYGNMSQQSAHQEYTLTDRTI